MCISSNTFRDFTLSNSQHHKVAILAHIVIQWNYRLYYAA